MPQAVTFREAFQEYLVSILSESSPQEREHLFNRWLEEKYFTCEVCEGGFAAHRIEVFSEDEPIICPRCRG